MLKITYEQFEEVVANAIEKHVSLDPDIAGVDQQWEAHNVAETLSNELRKWGIAIPAPGDNEPDRERENRYADRLGRSLAPIFK